MNLIPVQYRIAALVALFALSISAAFGAGWQVNGWRINLAHETARANTATSIIEKTGVVLDRYAMKAQQQADIAKTNADGERAARKAAQEGFDAVRKYLESHGGCRVTDADARLLRENADRRRSAATAAAAH